MSTFQSREFCQSWSLNSNKSSSGSYSVVIRRCPFSRDGRIYPIPSAIACTLSLHFARFKTTFFKPIFSVSYTCFFLVFFGRPRFLLPLLSRFRAIFKTLSSSLPSTCPYHLTPFAIANRSFYMFCFFYTVWG